MDKTEGVADTLFRMHPRKTKTENMKEKLTDMQDRVLRSNRSPPGGSTKDKKGKKRY